MRVLRLVLALAAVALVAFAGTVAYFLREVRTFAPMTFERVRSEPEQVAEFALGGRLTPEAWGFPVYDEIAYRSTDGTRLSAWVLPPTAVADSAGTAPPPTDCALVFVHGRGDNRLKALKYLPLAREAGLTQRCLTVFPDLRNSGRSESAASDMGWRFADDIAATLAHLAETYGTRRVTLYTFSVGAMGTAVMLNRADLATHLRQRVVWIERIVMDSPMANVEANVRLRADAMGVPAPVTYVTLRTFNSLVLGDRLREMRLGRLLRTVRIPVLVLYSTADTTTPAALVEAERRAMASAVVAVPFDHAPHVHLVRHPATRDRYRSIVVRFLRPSVPRDTLVAPIPRAPRRP